MSTPLHAVPLPSVVGRRSAGASVVLAGLAVGVIDGLFALASVVALYGAPPVRAFQAITALFVGRGAAFAGGATTTAAGVAVHFGVALGWAAAYLLACQRSPGLRRLTAGRGGAILVGAAYGALVWACMQFAVIPLARGVIPIDHGPVPPFRLDAALVGLLGHMVVVGQPIVHVIRAPED